MLKPHRKPLTGWPDGPTPGSSRIPLTIGNLGHMLVHEGVTVRYNMIKKDVEIMIPGDIGTLDNRENVRMSRVRSLAARHGLSTRHIEDYVTAIADANAYNPVADWIDSKAWDGVDRLLEVIATVTTATDYPSSLKQTLLTKWLLSATAAAILPETFKARGVLVLQGAQGIGKTTWISKLVSDAALRAEFVRLDHHMDWSNKDSLLGAVNNWIVEFGELERSLKNLSQLKSFVTADVDKVRRPYDRRESVYLRRTVFAASVNDISFLIDDTGNTRWWTIAVARLDYTHEVDMQQVFAQLAVQLRTDTNAKWWLTCAEETELEAWNSRHRSFNAIAEQVTAAIDLQPPAHAKPCWMTASDVLRCLGHKVPTNQQAKECAAALRVIYGDSRKRDGLQKWSVSLLELDVEAWSPNNGNGNAAYRTSIDRSRHDENNVF